MDPIFRVTTPIRYPKGGGHATGFFHHSNQGLYLITSRHAVYDNDPPWTFQPEKIHIKVREKGDWTKTQNKVIDLYENEEPKWIEPEYSEADVVAISLDISLKDTGNTSFGTTSLGIEYTVPGKSAAIVDHGYSAVVAGYPILERPSYTPILRDALISSPLNLDFDVQPYFLIDAKLHSGTSGSPVMVESEDHAGNTILKLIGVHEGQYNLREKGSENLNRVWYFRHVLDKLNEVEPNLLDLF